MFRPSHKRGRHTANNIMEDNQVGEAIRIAKTVLEANGTAEADRLAHDIIDGLAFGNICLA